MSTNRFYLFMKKPKHVRLAEQFAKCYEEVKALSPFADNYLSLLDVKTKELKSIEKKLEECGGSIVGGSVSFKNKPMRKFLIRKT